MIVKTFVPEGHGLEVPMSINLRYLIKFQDMVYPSLSTIKFSGLMSRYMI